MLLLYDNLGIKINRVYILYQILVAAHEIGLIYSRATVRKIAFITWIALIKTSKNKLGKLFAKIK